MDREKVIIRTSILGIGANLVLVAFKAVIGLITNSIAILLDAVNNLSDALSSIITIIGTKLAGKAPDKKHPYGYGRIEYLTSVIIAALVLFAGATSLKESVDKLIHPEAAEYNIISLIIIAAAVVVKFLMGRYVKATGEKVNSQSLIASGSDALFDCILSLSTLAAAIVSLIWGLSLEGWLGLVISAIIIKAGIEMMMETMNSIIGSRSEKEMTAELRAKIRSYEGVRGAYDITLHDYGPGKFMGSVHVEVADEMTAREIHGLSQKIMREVAEEMGIVMTVGIYAANTTDPESVSMRDHLHEILKEYPGVLQMHGFYKDDTIVTFDLKMDFKADAPTIQKEVNEKMTKAYPDCRFIINLDSDYSD